MKTNRQELLDALIAVQPGLASKEVIEQSSSFIFIDGEVVAYNDEIAISCPVEGLGIVGAVEARPFLKLLQKLPDTEIEIMTKGEEIRIESGRRKAGVNIAPEVTIPLKEIGKPQKWNKVPQGFSEGVSFCSFSASSDMTKPILTCLHISGVRIQSCDDFRATRCDIGKWSGGDVLLPTRAARILVQYEPTHWGSTTGWIHFKNEETGVRFSCRTLEDRDYPDLDRFFDVEGLEIDLPEATAEILDRVRIFSEQEHAQDEEIEVTLRENKMVLHGKGSSGWMKERIKVGYGGDEEIRFHINPVFFSDILEILDSVIVADNMLKLDGDDFSHVVMLLSGESE